MSKPLIVGVLAPDNPDDELGYRVYTQAYAIEMQIDDEADATTLLLAPYSTAHVFSSTSEEDEDFDDEDFDEEGEEPEGGSYQGSIPLFEMGDVHAGAYGIADETELKSLDELHRARMGWLLLPHTATKARIEEAISAGLRPVIHLKLDLPDADLTFLAELLDGLPKASVDKIVLALDASWTFEEGKELSPEAAAEFCQKCKAATNTLDGAPGLVYAGSLVAEEAASYTAQESIDGVLFHHERLDDEVCYAVLSALESIG